MCQPTTAAQYFHLLRRQVQRSVRKPLIIFTPKSGLRDKRWRSSVESLTHGTFEELLGDQPDRLDAAAVTRLVLASGKVAVDALTMRDELGADVAVARVEQLYPWPFEAVAKELEPLPELHRDRLAAGGAREHGRLERRQGLPVRTALRDSYTIRRISRPDEGSPATGKPGDPHPGAEHDPGGGFAPLEPRDRSQFT